jgi:hypothetical protein
MPGVDQSLEQLQQYRDIIEMQSGGWFVENKKIAAWRNALPLAQGRAEARPSRFSEVANEF